VSNTKDGRLLKRSVCSCLCHPGVSLGARLLQFRASSMALHVMEFQSDDASPLRREDELPSDCASLIWLRGEQNLPHLSQVILDPFSWRRRPSLTVLCCFFICFLNHTFRVNHMLSNWSSMIGVRSVYKSFVVDSWSLHGHDRRRLCESGFTSQLPERAVLDDRRRWMGSEGSMIGYER
jgi:hypothetical protein